MEYFNYVGGSLENNSSGSIFCIPPDMLYLSIHTTSYVNLKLVNFNVRHHIDGISIIKCALLIVKAFFYSLCNMSLVRRIRMTTI